MFGARNWLLKLFLFVVSQLQQINPFAPPIPWGDAVSGFAQWLWNGSVGMAFRDASGHVWTMDEQGFVYDNGDWTGYQASQYGLYLAVQGSE